MYDWYDHPIDPRAQKHGELGVNGRLYKGGEFLPFYIPRPEMPQIDEKDYPDFFRFLDEKGVAYRHETLKPEALRAHQRISWDKVRSLTEEQLAKPIVASNDFYVCDGNHRWHGHAIAGTDVPTIIINAEFEYTIHLMFSFPATYNYIDQPNRHEATK